MIIAIRRYLKGPGFKGVLWLTLISVTGFWGLPSFFKNKTRGGASGGGPAIATINGMEISRQEYNRVTNIQQEFLRKLRVQYGQYAELIIQSMGMNADPKALALDILIRDTLISQAADALCINITQGYMDYKLERPDTAQRQLAQILPPHVFDPAGNLNPAALNRYLAQQRVSHEGFNELIREAFSRELALGAVSMSSYVPQFALQEKLKSDNAKKQFSVMTLAFDPVLKKEQATPLANEEVKKYFDIQNHSSKKYWTPEKRTGLMWTFNANTFGVTVDEKEIESYYQDYRGQKFVATPMKVEARTIVFKGNDQAALDKAMAVRQELLAHPGAFADKAKELSIDKETAKNGGLVPLFAKGTHDKAFEKAAFLLKQDGDISEPVVTARGVEIVQRVSRKDAEFKPLSSVKDEVKELLIVEKFKKEFSDAVGNLIDQGSQAEYKKFADAHGATQAAMSAVEGEKEKPARALFGLREKGTVTSYFDGNKAVIVQLDEVVKKEIPALESVRTRVEQDMYKERAEKTFKKLIKATAAKAVETPLAELAKSVGATVETVNGVQAENKASLDAMEKKGLPVDSIMKLDKVGCIASKIDDKNGYIVRLDAVEQVDVNALQDKKQELYKKIEHEYSMYFVEGFVASLYRNATIKTSESMANTAREDDYTPIEDYL